MLTGIGLTGVEAAAYVAALREPGATAYRVSQLIGKPAPNTYKALDALRAKGAVVADDSRGSRTYVALPVREYLNHQRRELDDREKEIEQALGDMPVDTAEQGIYRLATVEQVYERCRSMIAAAKSVILLDAFPAPLAELEKAARAACRRGVKVFVKTYAPIRVAGCDVLAPAEPDLMLKMWNGDWLNLVVDSSESVQSFLMKDGAGVHAAAWCRNRYLSMLDYNGMSSEFLLTKVIEMLRADSDADAIKKALSGLIRRYLWDDTFTHSAPDSWMTGWRPKRKAGAKKARKKK
jgi:sugar-specific transcriptional regulator TrmB